MTTEEKAKAYDMALEAARKELAIEPIGNTKEVLAEIFPELRESEDERIRKEIRNFLIDMECKKEWIAYMEKQKEHQNNSDAPNESSWSGIISSSDKDMNIDEIAQDYVDGVKEYNPEPTWDLMQTAVCYGYHYREQKQQMLKDAIYYVVQDDLDSHGVSYNIPFIRIGEVALKPKGIGVGDKVRIVVMNEDD